MEEPAHLEILAAGAVAAFTVDVLVYPLDTIKTRYQSQGSLSLKTLLYSASSTGKTPYPVVRGLYQGIGSVVLATLPAAGIFFASYESAKKLLGHSLPAATPGPFIHAIASASAEMASCFVLTPAEVIKQNAQVLRRSGSFAGRSSSLQAIHMLRAGGRSVTETLWRGYTALVARNLPFTAVQFPIFEYLRGKGWELRGRQASRGPDQMGPEPALDEGTKGTAVHRNLHSLLVETGLVTGCAAALSGSFAATITTPADVVKTRVMLGAGDMRNSSGLDIVRIILRESGVRGLFRGAVLRAAWAALGSGLYLGSYEAAKTWLKERPQRLSLA